MKTSIREMKEQIKAIETTAIESAIDILEGFGKSYTAEELVRMVESRTGIEMTAQQLRANFANAGRTTNSRKKCSRQENSFKPVYTSRFEAIGKLKLKKEIEETTKRFVEVDEKGEIVLDGQLIEKIKKTTKYSVQ